MDWPTLLQTLSDSASASASGEIAAQESALQFVLGETTFVLEHDETEGQLLAIGVLGRVPVPGVLPAGLLMHFLKTNMRLQGAGLGSIACDPLEDEFVWRHSWSMEHTAEQEVLEALQEADAMRAELEAEHWLPAVVREEPDDLEVQETRPQGEAEPWSAKAETDRSYDLAASTAAFGGDLLTKILAW